MTAKEGGVRVILSAVLAIAAGVLVFFAGVRLGPQLAAPEVPPPPESLSYETTSLCTAPEGLPFRVGRKEARSRLQFHTHAEAPGGAIDRDRFTELRTSAEWMILLGIAEASNVGRGGDFIQRGSLTRFLGGLKCEEVDAPIGEPDVDLTIEGTADGYQIAVTIDGETNRSTHKWKE